MIRAFQQYQQKKHDTKRYEEAVHQLVDLRSRVDGHLQQVVETLGRIPLDDEAIPTVQSEKVAAFRSRLTDLQTQRSEITNPVIEGIEEDMDAAIAQQQAAFRDAFLDYKCTDSPLTRPNLSIDQAMFSFHYYKSQGDGYTGLLENINGRLNRTPNGTTTMNLLQMELQAVERLQVIEEIQDRLRDFQEQVEADITYCTKRLEEKIPDWTDLWADIHALHTEVESEVGTVIHALSEEAEDRALQEHEARQLSAPVEQVQRVFEKW